MAGDWGPVPFREFVVKVHSRCDLACDYCDVYEMAGQSWPLSCVAESRSLPDASLSANRHLFSGLLCTIDLRNDSRETCKALAEFDPPAH
jgi:hypothetical protein